MKKKKTQAVFLSELISLGWYGNICLVGFDWNVLIRVVRSDNSLDVSTSFACNGLFAMEDSAGMAGSKIGAVSSSPLSHRIRGREIVGKYKSTRAVLPKVSDVGNTLAGPTTFSSKMTSHRI